MEEQSKGAEAAKRLAEVVKERMELQLEHYAETELSHDGFKQSANNLSDTDYALQKPRAAAASLIKNLKEERETAGDKSKWDLEWIRDIVLAWGDRTKRLVEESSV